MIGLDPLFFATFRHKKTALIQVEYNPDESGFECLPDQTSYGSKCCSRRDKACLSVQKLSLLNGSVEFTNLIELTRQYLVIKERAIVIMGLS